MSYLNDFMERVYHAPDNAQCGYRYTSTGLTLLHVTSAVQTDEDAIAYIENINHWYPKTQVMLIEKRDAGQQNWRLIHRVEEAVGQLHVLQPTPVRVPVVPQPEARQQEDRPARPAVALVVPPVPRPTSPS